MRHSVDVANDVIGLIRYTNYIAQIILKTDGTYIKAGDPRKKAAVLVNVTSHRNENNNWLQDKWLAAKLAFRLVNNLRKI